MVHKTDMSLATARWGQGEPGPEERHRGGSSGKSKMSWECWPVAHVQECCVQRGTPHLLLHSSNLVRI